MPIDRLNIEIDQGSVFNPVLTWKKPNGDPVDLTNYEGKMQIRGSRENDSELIWEGDTTDGGLNVFGSSGQFRPRIGSETTIDFNFSWAYYDIQLTPNGEVDSEKLIVGGNVKLNKTVISES